MKKPNRKIRKTKCSERKMSKMETGEFLKLIEARIKTAEKALLNSMWKTRLEDFDVYEKTKAKK